MSGFVTAVLDAPVGHPIQELGQLPYQPPYKMIWILSFLPLVSPHILLLVSELVGHRCGLVLLELESLVVRLHHTGDGGVVDDWLGCVPNGPGDVPRCLPLLITF